ncbi:MAG: site-specific integrase [Planctomycetota bacterium]|nr:site-specific integrase [Planctomycetota bacterium]
MRTVRIPKYCFHAPTGQAYIRIRGRTIYLGKHGTVASREAYGRAIAEFAASSSKATIASPVLANDLTVVELCSSYQDFAEGYYVKNGQPSGWLAHIRLIIKRLCGLYGREPAATFGPVKFKAVRQTLVDAGHSRPYINKLIAIIPRVFKWGAAEELVPASVYHSLRTVEGLKKGRTKAREPDPVLPVEDALVDATLPHLPLIVADMARFQHLTGCRPGEVCQVRPMDVDRSGDVWCFRPGSHKTEHHGRERIIFVGPKGQAVLLPYLLRDATAYCFSPAESMQNMRDARQAARKTPLRYGNRPGTNRKARPYDHRRPATLRIPTIERSVVGSTRRTRRSRKQRQRAASGIPRCSATGTPTSYATPEQRRFDVALVWRPRKQCWGTRRPTSRRFTPSGTNPWRLKSCGKLGKKRDTFGIVTILG